MAWSDEPCVETVAMKIANPVRRLLLQRHIKSTQTHRKRNFHHNWFAVEELKFSCQNLGVKFFPYYSDLV